MNLDDLLSDMLKGMDPEDQERFKKMLADTEIGHVGLGHLRDFFLSTAVEMDTMDAQIMVHWGERSAIITTKMAQQLGAYIIDAASRADYDAQMLRYMVEDKGMSMEEASDFVRGVTHRARNDIFTMRRQAGEGDDG